MRKLHRVVQQQVSNAVKNVVDTQEEFDQVEDFIFETVADSAFDEIRRETHELIWKPFSYPTPPGMKYACRFVSPFSRRLAWFGAYREETSIRESAFHYMKERAHLKKYSIEETYKTIFSAECKTDPAVDVTSHKELSAIMSPTDYSASWSFVDSFMVQPDVIIYPSCRHEGGICVAVFEISLLSKTISDMKTLCFLYDPKMTSLRVTSVFDTSPAKSIEIYIIVC